MVDIEQKTYFMNTLWWIHSHKFKNQDTTAPNDRATSLSLRIHDTNMIFHTKLVHVLASSIVVTETIHQAMRHHLSGVTSISYQIFIWQCQNACIWEHRLHFASIAFHCTFHFPFNAIRLWCTDHWAFMTFTHSTPIITVKIPNSFNITPLRKT